MAALLRAHREVSDVDDNTGGGRGRGPDADPGDAVRGREAAAGLSGLV